MVRVGDVVVIDRNLEESESIKWGGKYTICTTKKMTEYRGRTARVTKVGTNLGADAFHIDIDPDKFHWTEDMMEQICRQEKRIVTEDEIKRLKDASDSFFDFL